MLNYSTRFKELIKSDVRGVLYELNITLVDGTEIAINNSHLWGDSLSLEDGTSENEKFTIGSAISTKLSFGLNNIYGDFSDYSFDRSTIILKIGMMVDGVKEMEQVGKFIVDSANYDSSIISITALDNFIKMDSLVSAISFPTTTQTLVQNICSTCGITNNADSFLRDHNFDIIEFDYSNMTYRALLAYLCQYMCCFAKMDTQGRLTLNWYQDIFDDVQHQGIEVLDSFTSLKLSTDFIEISGVEVVLDDEHKYSIGTENYLVSVANNPIIANENMALSLRDRLYLQVGGYKFKKCDADTLLYLWLESGDVVYIKDKEVNYPIFISNRKLSSNGSVSISCDAESPLRNSLVGNDSTSSAIRQLRQDLKKETDDRTRVEEELRQEIAGAGGVYETEVEGAEGEGGKIKYLHNKPLLADSAIQWKFTATTISVSKDYGQTWEFALNSDGQAILNQIYALGINADYVNTGYIKGLNEFKVEVYGVKTNFDFKSSYTETSTFVNSAYVGGKFFARDNYYTYVSEDNVNWTRMTPNISVDCWVKLNDGRVAGVCNAQKILVVTNDNLKWVALSSGQLPLTVYKMFNANGTLFMCDQWGSSTLYYTTDFISINAIATIRQSINDIKYFSNENVYVVCGSYDIYASTDLSNWTTIYNNVRRFAGFHFINNTSKYLYIEMSKIFQFDSIWNFANATIKTIEELGIEGYLTSSKHYDGILLIQTYVVDGAVQTYPVYYFSEDLASVNLVPYRDICPLSYGYDGKYYYYAKKDYNQPSSVSLCISTDVAGTNVIREELYFKLANGSIDIPNGLMFKLIERDNKYFAVAITRTSDLGGITNSFYLSKNEEGKTNFYIKNNSQDGGTINEVSASNNTSVESNFSQSFLNLINKDGIYGDYDNSLILEVDRTSHFAEGNTYLRNDSKNIIHQTSFESFDSDTSSAQTVIQNFSFGNKITNQISLSNYIASTYDAGGTEYRVNNIMTLANSDADGVYKNRIQLNYGTPLVSTYDAAPSETTSNVTELIIENKQNNYDLIANKLELKADDYSNSVNLKNYLIGSEDTSNSLELYCSNSNCSLDLKNRRNYLSMSDDGTNCNVRLHNGSGSYLSLSQGNNANLYAWNSVQMQSANYYCEIHPKSDATPAKFWFSNDGHIYFCQYESQVGNSLYRVA